MAAFTILGASGFIGGYLVRALRDKGHDVFAPTRGATEIYSQELGFVVYCIGYSSDYWQHPLNAAEAHACLLISLLRHAKFDGLVYLSSVRLCDGLEGVARETGVLRLDPLNLRNVYDLSKGLGESLVHHGGRLATVARLGSVYDDELAQDDFLCRTVHRAVREKSIKVDSSPDLGRDYIHVDDVCAALEAIALKPFERVYHVATGTLFSNQQLADLCEREFGCRVEFVPSKTSLKPPVIDIERLVRDFGIRPQSAERRLPAILRNLSTRHV